MAQRRPLKLTTKQREDLTWHRDYDFRPYVRERCAALLKIAEGQAAYAVSQQGLLKKRDADTVYNWRDIYERDGLAGLIARQHGGAHRTNTDQCQELLTTLQNGPGEEAKKEVMLTAEAPTPARWSLRTIRVSVASLTDYSISGVWRVLRRNDLLLRSAKIQQWSPDPDYLRKQARLLKCLREGGLSPKEMIVLFIDEMGFYRWPEPATTWALSAPEPFPLAERAGGNNQQWRTIGALNAMTGRVDYLDNYIIGREKVIAFYHQLDQAYKRARCIYVVQDNWSIHRHPDVLEALIALPRILPVWLPTYSPWLNPIEKLWRWLRQDVLKMHRHVNDWKQVRQLVRAFLDQFARGSKELLYYVGLLGDGKLARALRPT